jgi:hypothetical protein
LKQPDKHESVYGQAAPTTVTGLEDASAQSRRRHRFDRSFRGANDLVQARHWNKYRWPQIKKALCERRMIVFVDESGLSERPQGGRPAAVPWPLSSAKSIGLT